MPKPDTKITMHERGCVLAAHHAGLCKNEKGRTLPKPKPKKDAA